MDTTDELRVFIASNRQKNGNFPDCTNQYYTTEPSDQISFFSCDVNVPLMHSVGAIDVGANQSNRDKYFSMGNHREMSENKFMSRINGGKSDPVMVFIHGFNVNFEESAYRAAQIAYDLKFQGNIVLFSWPAGPENKFVEGVLKNITYQNDKNNAANSVDQAVQFFNRLGALNGKIYIVVHSMGHQVVVPALFKIGQESKKKFIKELVFNAPDFDITEMRAMLGLIQPLAERITMYCSPGDNALVASKTLNQSHRAGLCAKIHGVDVINVNEVDTPVMGVGGLGHGYYSSRPLLVDLIQLFWGVEVEKRLFIRKGMNGNSEDYVLRR
ncbi:MAG: alpha/beta hydrolase [Spirochaetia bacterium]|nr:alpha/beta hydrolase [Spirochaetia bacterium]